MQVTGFASRQVNSSVTCAAAGLPSGCKSYTDPATNLQYKFYYPNDETTQYLYETYPRQISPLEGVTNEHFIVWMRTSALPDFRKLYGKIEGPFSAGNVLSFMIEANFEVHSFGASKALVVSTQGQFGQINPALGVVYLVVGIICFICSFIFFIKQQFFPRILGNYKTL